MAYRQASAQALALRQGNGLLRRRTQAKRSELIEKFLPAALARTSYEAREFETLHTRAREELRDTSEQQKSALVSDARSIAALRGRPATRREGISRPGTLTNRHGNEANRSPLASGPYARIALSLMRTRSHDAITVEELCEYADVGRSTFYAHFTGKADLKPSGFEKCGRSFRNVKRK